MVAWLIPRRSSSSNEERRLDEPALEVEKWRRGRGEGDKLVWTGNVFFV